MHCRKCKKNWRTAARLKGFFFFWAFLNRRTHLEDTGVPVIFRKTCRFSFHCEASLLNFKAAFKILAGSRRRLTYVSSLQLKTDPRVSECSSWNSDNERSVDSDCSGLWLFSSSLIWSVLSCVHAFQRRQMDFLSKAPLVCDVRTMNCNKPLYFLI